MIDKSLARCLLAEFLGTLILLATVIGSGIMGEQLAGGNSAIALLGNTIATGTMLCVLITLLGPVSGAHFNPAVSLAMGLAGKMPWPKMLPYVLSQALGAIVGVWLAHAMFDLPVLQVSEKLRWGAGQWLSEAVATAGLLLTIFGGLRANPAAIPALVGLYITAAYWFTASTSFANPAVTLARGFSNSFAGIAPGCVLPFMAAQLAGVVVGLGLSKALFGTDERRD